MTDLATAHDELRPLIFSVAYRMLGSVTEAEDITQEALLRMHRERDRISSAEAFAVTVTTRLAIDQLRSARVRREQYVGPWLPEPLLSTGEDADPAVRVETDETLTTAFLMVLETLSPTERAVFLLHEVFQYGYDDIAAIVGKTVPNCRQIFARARAHVDERKPRFQVSTQRRTALAERFFAACRDGDLAGLERLLAADVVFYGDGGGKAQAVTKPVRGRVQVARFMLGLMRQAATHRLRFEPVPVNGQPGARLIGAGGAVLAVLTLQVADDQVQLLHNVLNPDKLRHLRPAGSP
jgi:RNA polymerase sigma-70 factor (TIGR02957 family)